MKRIFILLLLILISIPTIVSANTSKFIVNDFKVTVPFQVTIDTLYANKTVSLLFSTPDGIVYGFSSWNIDRSYYKKNKAHLPEDLSSSHFLEDWKHNILTENRPPELTISYSEIIPIKNGIIYIIESPNTKHPFNNHMIFTYHIMDNKLYYASAMINRPIKKDDAISLAHQLIESIYPK